jgi:hypothetical protein
MTNNAAIISSIKFIIAFFAATMMCAVIYAIPASAASEWTTGNVSTDTEYYINDSSSGTVTVGEGVKLTVTGSYNSASANILNVVLDIDASLEWRATVNGGGSLIVTALGAGASVDFIGAAFNTTGSPAVSIGAGLDMVTISNARITCTTGSAIQTQSSITMTSGEVSGTAMGIGVESGDSVTLSGGRITASTDRAVNIVGVADIDISGVELVGNNYGLFINDSSANLNMTSGELSGKVGLYLSKFDTANITGGKITSTAEIGYRAVYVFGNGTVTIGGTANIDGGSANHGVDVNNGSAELLVTGGNISGANGIQLSFFDSATISGGTISGTGMLGQGIHSGITKSFKIKPTAGKTVFVKGIGQALFIYDTIGNTQPELENVLYYITSENYSGTPEVGTETATAAFVNESKYKFVKFTTEVPVVVVVDPPEEEEKPRIPTGGSNGPATSTTPPPPVDYASIREESITVTATLNKSGSVNSTKTAADVKTASGRTDKINLIIPEGGTGISDAAMKKIITAANGAKVHLYFGFYNSANAAAEDLGSVYVPISGATGQVLTSIYFDTKNIDYAESYIKRRWGKTMLDSFETADKSGWGESATVSVSLESLDFSADDGEKLYAAIYDPKTNKWYRANIEIIDGEAVIKTKRTGVYTILTEPIH